MAEHFRGAEHLPNRRGGQPRSPEELPRQRNGVTPQMHGRYPDYNVLDEASRWDELTRDEIMGRVDAVPSFAFFSVDEIEALRPFCDVVLAQDREPRVPVLEMVDAKLAQGKLDGFQYADMPDDRDTWRMFARALGQEAQVRGASDFAHATPEIQHEIVGALSQGEASGGIWEQIDPSTTWSVVMRGVLSEFYSHPWAWNEIGFGGPAYPRGYARMGADERESWEGREALRVDPVSDVKERGLE